MYDAVMLVPGILGSELVDDRGKVVWGLSPRVIASTFVLGDVSRLKVHPSELAGKPRLRPGKLLEFPAFLPDFGGVEPYAPMMRHLPGKLPAPEAFTTFPYDWRLSIEHAAGQLARAAERHLEQWRAVVRERFADRTDPDDVSLVLVAHSMGGLVARFAMMQHGLLEVTRRLLTLGTPFRGSLMAVRTLATGEHPLIRRASSAMEMARTCPSVFDLLPRYDCVTEPTSRRRLTAGDLDSLGVSTELFAGSERRHEKLRMDAPVPLSVLAGSDVATWDTVDRGWQHYEKSDLGDGTVPIGSAIPEGLEATFISQDHGTLARSENGIVFARNKMLGLGVAPPLGFLDLQVDMSTTMPVGRTEVRVTGADMADATVESQNLATQRSTSWRAQLRDGAFVFSADVEPGLHRISVGPGGDPISKLVEVVAATSGQRAGNTGTGMYTTGPQA